MNRPARPRPRQRHVRRPRRARPAAARSGSPTAASSVLVADNYAVEAHAVAARRGPLRIDAAARALPVQARRAARRNLVPVGARGLAARGRPHRASSSPRRRCACPAPWARRRRRSRRSDGPRDRAPRRKADTRSRSRLRPPAAQHLDGVAAAWSGWPPPLAPVVDLSVGQPASVPAAAVAPVAPPVAAVPALDACAATPWPSVVPPPPAFWGGGHFGARRGRGPRGAAGRPGTELAGLPRRAGLILLCPGGTRRHKGERHARQERLAHI